MKLIINADDFGLTNGVTYGIYDAIRKGIVTSTTMMVNAEGTALAAEFIKTDADLKAGLHLNLSLGRPLTDGKSLVNEKGCFIKPKELKNDEKYDENEIFEEFEAQYNSFVSLTGKKPTHIDSHLYLHQIFPKAERQAKKLSEKVDLPLRQFETKNYGSVHFEGRFKLAEGETFVELKQKFKDLIDFNKDRDVVELMVHPGYLDRNIIKSSSYSYPRTEEGAVLMDSDIKEFIENNSIKLISFAELERKNYG